MEAWLGDRYVLAACHDTRADACGNEASTFAPWVTCIQKSCTPTTAPAMAPGRGSQCALPIDNNGYCEDPLKRKLEQPFDHAQDLLTLKVIAVTTTPSAGGLDPLPRLGILAQTSWHSRRYVHGYPHRHGGLGLVRTGFVRLFRDHPLVDRIALCDLDKERLAWASKEFQIGRDLQQPR